MGSSVGGFGPNGYPVQPYGTSASVNSTTRTLPSLNLDLAPQLGSQDYVAPYQAPSGGTQPWQGRNFGPRNRGFNFNGGQGFNGAQGAFGVDSSVQLY
jgi:hypothetical protein